MKTTDYIFINHENKTLPFGVEFYVCVNRRPHLEYEGFASISEAISFVENSGLTFYKQK